jgi:RecA-family ATPase
MNEAPPHSEQHLTPINPAVWEGVEVPVREWIVQNLIPAHTVTLLTGDGAAGKTTLALQLAAARALDRNWIGTTPQPGRTLVLSAEDDADELHRRMNAIRVHYGVSFSDLANVRLVDLVGSGAVLGELTRNGTIAATHLYRTVVDLVREFMPDLVVIDALADAFAGDENNRSQARQFVTLLKQPMGGLRPAVLLLAHPSLSGMSSGSGMSGSTAWSNSVRSRLYFEAAKASDGSEPDPALRTLSVRKTNYAAAGAMHTVRWQDGAYVPITGMSALDRIALERRSDETFIALLKRFTEQGQNVSTVTGTSYAPAHFAKHPDANGLSKKHLADAMQRLLDRGCIRIDLSGPPSRQRSRLVIAENAE